MLGAATSGSWSAGGPAVTYSAFTTRSLARGITVHGGAPGFLPTGADVVDVSTAFAEGDLSSSLSTGLAALPYPSDAILGVPGLVSGAGQIPNLPGYPLAARADDPFTPNASAVQAGPGEEAAQVTAHADPHLATALAASSRTNDTSGFLNKIPLPGLPVKLNGGLYRVGSIRSAAADRRLNDTTVESTATTTLSDLGLVGGVVHIDQLTTTALVQLNGDRAVVGPTAVTVSGVTVAGAPAEITDQGLQLGSGTTAVNPVADAASHALAAGGVQLKVTASTHKVDGLHATSYSGSLVLTVRGNFEGFPTDTQVEFGGASADAQAVAGQPAPVAAGVAPPGATAPGVTLAPGSPAGPTASPVATPTGGGFASTGSAPPALAASPAPQGRRAVLSLPVAVDRLDFRPVYPWLALLGLVVVGLRRWLRRATAATADTDVHTLWRW